MKRSIYIGFEPREASAFMVACHSIRRHLSQPVPLHGLVLSDLQARGLYTRPTELKMNGDGRPHMIDVLSVRKDYDGHVTTQHANARFLVPHLAQSGWALFMDCDMLVRCDLAALLANLDPEFAVYCVKHEHAPDYVRKMDGQTQTIYPRKNWTSFMVFNCDHPANRALTVEVVNTLPGRDLHRLCWLDDSEIGALDARYNFLVGDSDPSIEPLVIHHTRGVPDMVGYENVPFADEWRAMRDEAARCALGLPVLP